MLKTNVYIKKYRKKKEKSAFSLSEILIVIVIFGIISAIIIPSLVKRHLENINRTRLKKSMTTYESILSKIVIENGIKDDVSLKNKFNNDNCATIRVYFKSVQDGDDNCTFKSSDGVWWNIKDIVNPVIMLNNKYKDNTLEDLYALAQSDLKTNKEVFAFVGHLDRETGTLRINDNTYEQTNGDFAQKAYMIKLWSYINGSNISISEFEKCKVKGQDKCVVKTSSGEEVEYVKMTISDAYPVSNICIYDRETKTQTCNQTSTATAGDYYIRFEYDVPSDSDAKSEDTCSTSVYSACATKGDWYEVLKQKCESQGARMANIAELKSLAKQGVIQNGWIFAAEEYNAEKAWDVRNDAYVTTYVKSDKSRQRVLCIGK